MELLNSLFEAVVAGDDGLTTSLTQEGVASGLDPQVLLDEAMIPAMAEVGQLFEDEQYFVPELLMAGRAMKAGFEVLRPLLKAGEATHAGTVVIATVEGDLHDIGKNLVAVMLEGAGFEVVDLGTNVAPNDVVAALEAHHPDILGLSALLTTTMLSMATTIETVRAAGLRDGVRIMVGGAPLTEARAVEFGADAYAENANTAVRTAQSLVGSP